MESKKLFDKYKQGKHWRKHPTIYSEKFAAFLKSAGIDGVVVDAGCGNGKDTAIFREYGFGTIGIDSSTDEINAARTNHPNCRFEVQNIETMTFQNNEVAAFFMINVVHYLKAGLAFREIRRCLKPGGYLFVHFNLSVVDGENIVDYKQDEGEIYKQLSGFEIVKKSIFQRIDLEPKLHKHRILELILRKN
jgi:SAM-dependent methyltransferase